MTNKKVLFISTTDLFNTRGGGALATLAYFNAIYEIYKGNVDIILAQKYVPKSSLNISVIPIPKTSLFNSLFDFIFHGHLTKLSSYVKSYMKKQNEKYDLCILNNGVYSAEILKDIKNYGLKTVVIHHNYEKEYFMDNKNPATFFGLYSGIISRKERRSYQNANLNLFLTIQDQLNLEKAYGKLKCKNRLLGCFEPFLINPRKIINERFNNMIVISGSLNTYQTKIGILDFYNNYFDLTRKIIPDLKLIITGRNPVREISAIAEENANCIEIVPNPTDIFSVIEKCSIYLCPTSIGSGLKLRVMDGLKMGMPILVHRISARGYDVFFDKPYFKIYDDEVSFRTGLTELLNYMRTSYFKREEIQSDYYNFFGFQSGVNQLKRILEDTFGSIS